MQTETYRSVRYCFRGFDEVVYIAEGFADNAAEGLPVFEIYQELPDWLTQRRIALCVGLVAALNQFQSGLLAVALKHRIFR